VIEESPSPSLTPALRKQMGDAAVAAARSINYTNAGTVEFILDKSGAFYFLEVNTRLQVEHPVTEETTGLDLVRLQIEVAQGLPLSATAEATTQHGHAIECRINAEDAENNFFPDTGEILLWHEPALAHVRYDSGVATGLRVEVFYDSMIAKVISCADTRAEAIQRMINALDKTIILGITTNRDFLKELLVNPSFMEYTNYQKPLDEIALHAAAITALLYDWSIRAAHEPFAHSLNGWRNVSYQPQLFELEYAGEKLKLLYTYQQQNKFTVTIGDKICEAELVVSTKHSLTSIIDGHRQTFYIAGNKNLIFVQHPANGTYKFQEVPRFVEPGALQAKGGYIAPMPGEIVKVLVKPGDKVQAGKGLLVISSMKMETTIEAHTDGEIEDVFVAEKLFVEAGAILLKMKDDKN
jgi:propionyl-CoA carboxylase alpha chain